jgi:hypothetical protein
MNITLISIIVIIVIILILTLTLTFLIFNKSQTNQKGSGYRVYNDLYDTFYVHDPSSVMGMMNKFDEHHNNYITYLCNYINATDSELTDESKYIVVGDVHGSILQLFMPLKQAKILNTISFNSTNNTFTYTLTDLSESKLVIYCGDLVGRAAHSLTVSMLITFCNIFKDVNMKYLKILQSTSSSGLSNDDFVEQTKQLDYYKKCKIVWTYGNHDIGFIKQRLFNGTHYFDDVYNSELCDITSDVNYNEMLNKLRENIIINPYPCIYYNSDLNIQVSHTIIPNTYQKNKVIGLHGLDSIYNVFNPNIDKFENLYKAKMNNDVTSINRLIIDISNIYKLPYNHGADTRKLEILERIFDEDELYEKPIVTKEDYEQAIPIYEAEEAKLKENKKTKPNDKKYIKKCDSYINYYHNILIKYKYIADNFDDNECNTNIYTILNNIRTNINNGKKIQSNLYTLDNNEQIQFINKFAKYVAITSPFIIPKNMFELMLYWSRPDLKDIVGTKYFVKSYYQIAKFIPSINTSINAKYFIGHSVMKVADEITITKYNSNIQNMVNRYLSDIKSAVNISDIDLSNMDEQHKNYLNTCKLVNNTYIDNYNMASYKINVIMAKLLYEIKKDPNILNDFLEYAYTYYSRKSNKSLNSIFNNNIFIMDIGATFAFSDLVNDLKNYYTLQFKMYSIIQKINETIPPNVNLLNDIFTCEIGYYMCGFAIGLEDGTVKSSKLYLF